MSIAPVRVTVEVKTPPARSFDLFTRDAGAWWPKGKTIGAKPHVDIVIEPRPDGRWFERDADGTECPWGKVLAWDPPGRLLLAWQLNASFDYDPALITEVELTFAPGKDGGTLVTLEHRDLHRLGDAARTFAENIGGGWLARLKDFVLYTGKETGQ